MVGDIIAETKTSETETRLKQISIKISHETHSRLLSYVGELQHKTGKRITLDFALNSLLDSKYKPGS